MDTAAELGRNPMSKHQIQPEYGNEQVDAGRKYRNPSHETKFSGANGDREIFISPVQLTSSRIGNLIRLIIILLYIVRSTVVQYGLLSVLGDFSNPSHILVLLHRIFGRIGNVFHCPSVLQVQYTLPPCHVPCSQ